MGGHAVAVTGIIASADVGWAFSEADETEVAVEVLWWLVPPLATTALAMVWAAWVGRARDDIRRDDSAAAQLRLKKALERPVPQAKVRSREGSSVRLSEPSHGVVIRRSSSRAISSPDTQR